MDAEFWHQRWALREIGFHQAEVNPLLATHFEQLQLAAGSRVFIPLCGKSLDMVWLLAQGCSVVGAELSEMAVRELFEALALQPQVEDIGPLKRYSAPDIEVYVGDIFTLTAAQLGPVDAVYDRAALVALPEVMREQYSKHLIRLSGGVPQLLITYEYDQDLMAGPPFSISQQEVEKHYSQRFAIKAVGSCEELVRGLAPATETAWLLQQYSES